MFLLSSEALIRGHCFLFPKDSINEETVELVQPYLEMEDFTLENAKKVSGDVAGLASWSQAMVFFYGVNKEVLPLKVFKRLPV